MDWKKLYEALESTEEGKKVAEEFKGEFGKLKDSDAKARKLEGELQKIMAKMAEMEKTGKAPPVEEDDDADDDAPPAAKPKKGKSEAEINYEKLIKKMNATTAKLEEAEKRQKETEQRVRSEKLRGDFGGRMREIFGKFGAAEAENLINRGIVKLDESGAIIYETADKIHSLDEAIELLKVEHKEYMVTKQTGSNITPPSSPKTAIPGATGKTTEELDKMSASALFVLGAGAAQ